MGNLLIVFLASFVTLNASAQTAAVKKIINKYDAAYLRSGQGFERPAAFWNTINKNDSRSKAFVKALFKKEKTLTESLAILDYAIENQPADITTSDYDSIARRLAQDLGIEAISFGSHIKVIKDNHINASMDPAGQMRINSGCFEKLTYNELLAVCAHEAAHGACVHVISRMWNVAKKQKSNRMWADIATSITIGMVGASSYYSGINGVDNSGLNNILANADIIYSSGHDYADQATVRFSYRYSRDEEAEADIIAYRFMEQLGYGGEHMLSMLQKLQKESGDYSVKTDKKSDHPSVMFRIQVISALMSGYSGKQK